MTGSLKTKNYLRYIRKKSKNVHKKHKIENFEKQKDVFFFSQGSFNLKIRFLGQKVCSVAWLKTDRHESDYCGRLFRISGVFPFILNRPQKSQQCWFNWIDILLEW